jgi:hypothetical protein
MSSDKHSRRGLLGLFGGAVSGVVLLSVPGCGYYEAESGEAFEPWDFPGSERRPEFLAALAALLASTPHNTQPWALAVSPERIDLYADLERNLGAMDSLGREMHIGLGCALENLVVAARHAGRQAEVTLLPDAGDETLVARVSLTEASADPSPLFEQLARRHTNRGTYADVAPPAGLEPALRSLLDDESVRLHWLASRAERDRFRAETIAATRAIIDDTAMSADGHRWYRHTSADLEANRDGTTLDATGNGAATRAAGKSLARPSDATADQYWLEGTEGRQTTGSAYVILSSDGANTRADQLRVGRLYQRLHLWATGQGLAMQPLNQLAERQDREETAALAPRFAPVLDELMGDRGRRAQMLFRIGYPWDDALASPRRPLEWVLR